MAQCPFVWPLVIVLGPGAPLGLSILYLIQQPENQAGAAARELVERAKTEIGDMALRSDLIELIAKEVMPKLKRKPQ